MEEKPIDLAPVGINLLVEMINPFMLVRRTARHAGASVDAAWVPLNESDSTDDEDDAFKYSKAMRETGRPAIPETQFGHLPEKQLIGDTVHYRYVAPNADDRLEVRIDEGYKMMLEAGKKMNEWLGKISADFPEAVNKTEAQQGWEGKMSEPVLFSERRCPYQATPDACGKDDCEDCQCEASTESYTESKEPNITYNEYDN